MAPIIEIHHTYFVDKNYQKQPTVTALPYLVNNEIYLRANSTINCTDGYFPKFNNKVSLVVCVFAAAILVLNTLR